MCTVVISNCNGLSSAQCTSRQGCFLGPTGCTGNFGGACSTFADQTSCNTQATNGCTWNPIAGSCGSTPPACSSWGSNASTCSAAGCTPQYSCNGTYLCSQWNASNGGNSTTCNSHAGCSWVTTGGGKCNPQSPAQTCSGLSQVQCTPAGCSWQPTSCGGSPPACTTYGSNQTTCQAAGCTYTPSSGSCTGSYLSSCSTYDSNQTSCQNTAGCTWVPAACAGTAASCGSFTDQSQCIAQAGCSWQ